MFMTLEGGEGAGKTTQAIRLVDKLREAGYTTHFTREPGGTPLGTAIRALLLHPDESLRALAAAGLAQGDEPAEPVLPITEVLLLSAGRAQHVARMREWLATGEIVVCDRYADATRAYQGAARGLDVRIITQAEALATGGLKPDLTLLFDLPASEGLKRKRRILRSSYLQLGLFDPPAWNRLDRETLEFHERVREGYRELAKQEPERWVVIDASQATDEITTRVWAAVSERLPPRP